MISFEISVLFFIVVLLFIALFTLLLVVFVLRCLCLFLDWERIIRIKFSFLTLLLIILLCLQVENIVSFMLFFTPCLLWHFPHSRDHPLCLNHFRLLLLNWNRQIRHQIIVFRFFWVVLCDFFLFVCVLTLLKFVKVCYRFLLNFFAVSLVQIVTRPTSLERSRRFLLGRHAIEGVSVQSVCVDKLIAFQSLGLIVLVESVKWGLD